jgi:transcriptional regulator with XRE-family HTH domain
MTLGTKIAQLRVKNNLSLQDVATKTGISKAHVWEMEKGKSGNPSLELLTKLADTFKVSVAYLTGEDPRGPEEKEGHLALYRDLKKLDDKDLATIQMLVEQFKQNKKK